MLGLLIVLVGGLFVAIVAFHGSIVEVQRQIGDLRAEVHQEIGDLTTDVEGQINDLRTDVERQISDLRTDLGQRMARLEAIMEVHFGTPSLPADDAGDNAPAQ